MDWKVAILIYACCTAGWSVLAKVARNAGLSGPATSLICSFSACLIVLLGNISLVWGQSWPRQGVFYAVIAGILGGVTSLLYYRFLKDAPFASFQPLTELYLILIPLLAFIVFAEAPTVRQVIGMCLGFGAMWFLMNP